MSKSSSLLLNPAHAMVVQLPQRPKYPLHRTCVTKRIRTHITKIIQSNDDGGSDEEENDNGFESPFFAIGRLVNFHVREDQARMYTIRWDHYTRKLKNPYADDIYPKSDSESPPESQSESMMPRANDTSTELWTESRVNIGILLNRSMGLKIAKFFETGDFIGQVTNVYASGNQNDGEVFYCIKYGDGDTEDFDDKELQEGVALYCRIQNQQKRTNGIVNQSIGLEVAKHFEKGVFIGQVKNIYSSGKQNGELFYRIEYEDGDSEDFDEKQLQEGVALYCRIRKRKKRARKDSKEKESRLSGDFNHPKRKPDKSHSFGALCDKSTAIHTLILGTHPAKISLNENRYFAHPRNAFWWIAGDCLGFRRDRGEKSAGGLMKLCANLRYDESHIIPYEKQINVLCQHGFALWDIIASCQRKGSLDRAIKNDKPNDIKKFVEQNPTIKTIVMANGKSGLNFFNRHFSNWWKSGKLILHKGEVTSSRFGASTSNLNENKLGKVEKADTITCVCALSVSPAATLPYKEKRDFWDEFVYTPGLELHQQLATAQKLSIASSSFCSSDGIVLPSKT